MITGGVRKIGPGQRGVTGVGTAGMVREEAVTTPGIWAGLVRTEAGMVGGWHHHDEYETAFYVVSGGIRVEFGPGGESAVEAGPEDFVYVPPRVVHREINPGDQESQLIVFRGGHGSPVVNVDGPEA